LIEGQLDVVRFHQALETVLTRHENYRTCLQRVPGMVLPLQVINAEPLFTTRSIDLCGFAPHEQQRHLEAVLQAEKTREVDLARGPLVSSVLLMVQEQTFYWLLSLSVLHADPQTLQNLVREVAHCYHSSAALADDIIQYVQFSEWQNTLFQEDRDEEKAYWGKKDFSALLTASLPFKAATKSQRSFDPDVLTVALCSDDSLQMKALVEQQQWTLPALFLTCWYLLLWKLTGQQERILVGLSADGRIEDLRETAGLISKYLPLTCSLNDQQSVRDLLVQVQDSYDELLSHHPYFNWDELEGITEPASFSYPFSFEWREQEDLSNEGSVSFTLQQWESYFEPFHVKLVVVHGSMGVTVQIHFDRSLFDRQQIERMAAQMSLLIAQVIRQPEQRLETLDVLSKAERQQLLVQFHHNGADYPDALCLHQMFEQQVARTPDAVAVESEQKQLTYDQLNRQANRLAHYLQQMGVGPEVLVGIGLEQSIEMVIGILGILKAGGAYVPLDITYPKKRLGSIVEGARISVLLTNSRLLEHLPSVEQVVCLDDDWGSIAQYNGNEQPVCAVLPTNLAYAIYTSGSTGHPKGVMIPHQGVVHYVDWSSKHYAVADGSGSPVHSPLSFDLTITSLFPSLVVGRRLVLVPREPGIEALRQMLLMNNGFSVLKITPAHLNLLGQSLQPEEFADVARALIIGGEELHSESLRAWRQYAPATRLINEYGPTETVVGCCIYEVPQGEERVGAVPIGRPIPNTQIYLLDSHLRPVPFGVPGELYIGGVGVGRGYLNRPDLTAERFIANPFSTGPGTRLYKTGDLARYISADGTLEYLGRVDNQVKLRGYRIELTEIEAVLRQHPQVRDCVVMMREDRSGGSHLVGYVVPKKLPVVADMNIRDFMQEYLPNCMLPAVFVYLKFLPLTVNGKVDRRKLIADIEEGGHADILLADPNSVSRIVVQPRDGVEMQLLRIWEDILPFRPISVVDNFFDIGGHSLLAVRLMAHIAECFGRNLELSALFQYPTIAELAIVLRQQKTYEEQPRLVAIQPQGSRPPFFCVHPSGGTAFCYVNLARSLGPEQPFYGLHAPFGATIGGEEKTVGATIEEMAAHYITAIQTVQPQGPYLLGGWSLGGVIALEMAQQLQRQGHDIGVLAIIDSMLSDPQRRARAMEEVVDLSTAGVVRDLISATGVVVPDDFDQRMPDAQLNYVVEQAKKNHVLPADIGINLVQIFTRVRIMIKHIARIYVASDYPRKIDYFLSDLAAHEENFDKAEDIVENAVEPIYLQSWRELAKGGLEIHRVPGNHMDIINEPNVQVLAKELKQCIDKFVANL
jgi:amino acid adenylation domain-containing protein